ncbi:hypothetical protein GCM10023205_68210 [Yinghuangia aomiensis]|uniref:Uncharacterized protein n=1 Tax=Yinghuangia aomiensis TaxID=676205 RepID=A0ABP9I4N7_9ACTN
MYSWLDGGGNPVPYGSLVFVKALAPDEVIRRLGADPASARRMTDEERTNQDDAVDLLSVRDLGGGWALAFEPGGADAFVEEPVRPLSADTEVVMFNRNILAHCRFRHFVDGVLWTYFDAVAPDERHGLHPDRLAADMRRISLTPAPDDHDLDDYDDEYEDPGVSRCAPIGHWGSMTMALVESVTGVRLHPQAFAMSATTVVRRFSRRRG